MITENRTMSRATVEAAVESIESTWEVREVDPATGGHHLVSHVAVETSEGPRECVLKATPGGKEPTVDDEARLLSVLGSHTSLPRPEVLGVVDEHLDLPTPFVLMSSLPGETVHRMEMDALSTETVAGIARSVGEYFADLHRLDPDGLDAFGRVTCERTGTLRGSQPDPTLDRLRLVDPEPSWEGYLRSSIEGVLDRFETERECYELLAHLHSAANFEDWLRLNDASEETIETVALEHRRVLRERL